MASPSHHSAFGSFRVQTVCDKPREQGRPDINVERTFYDAFMLSDWSSHYRLVRVELSSTIGADSLPFTVGNVYAVIKDEVDALKQFCECVSAIRFAVNNDADEPKGRGRRASGSAFDVAVRLPAIYSLIEVLQCITHLFSRAECRRVRRQENTAILGHDS